MAIPKDETLLTTKWQFDDDVTAVFDDMLARSIPQYPVMRDAVDALATRYLQPHTAVVDLGSSRGEAVARLIDRHMMVNRFFLTDVSAPMLDTLRDRFAHGITMNSVTVQECDLRYGFPLCEPSLVLSILTLQFVPIEYRQQIIQTVYDKLLPGGAFLFVEKVLGATAPMNQTFVDMYYDMKRANGYTEEQIQRKRLSLEGVLVPVTAAWNEALLQQAGFRQVDCFWRWANFAGWVAVKD